MTKPLTVASEYMIYFSACIDCDHKNQLLLIDQPTNISLEQLQIQVVFVTL